MSLIAELRAMCGDSVVSDPEAMTPFVVDWTRRFGGPALCVVKPRSTEEVARVMRACAAAGVPVIAQGGNTGLVGGAVPAASGPLPVIVSLVRMNEIGPIDELSGQLTAGAGATLGDVQRAAADAGWMYGVDLAARDSATIGGTVATNAGGIRVLAFGMTRAQVVGVEAVLPDGSVISHLGGMLKDNTGFDLGALLCGSEGTLAIITAVRVRLHRPFGASTVALVGADSYADALTLVHGAVAPGYALVAAEVIDDVGMDLLHRVSDLPYPFDRHQPLTVLLEVADGGTGDGLVLSDDRSAVVAFERGDKERLWKYRELQAEAYGSLGVIHKLDVSVPLAVLPEFSSAVRAALSSAPEVEVVGIFGHLADGNLHVEFFGPAADDMRADEIVLDVVAAFGGSVSAEHGIGRAKVGALGLTRSASEISAMRAIKNAWDPQGLMNPGVLFSS